ncbi:MAG TPA: prolyl oligopeptidase family serine peptidase, partial [Candidatus Kapabacteria bacterium]|nr:prolyl oligopeptidase family serine peptidase [Candidatus Kapabacteria bacterium]
MKTSERTMNSTPWRIIILCFCGAILALHTAHADATRSLPDTIRIKQWLAVGPFLSAPRENAIDYLTEHGGESAIQPREGMEHTSVLVPGAIVRWHTVTADSTGLVKLDYDSLGWDTLAQYYGTAGLMTTSYAYAEFTSASDGCMLALADGVASFRLNGVVWPGDQYRQHVFLIPVPVRRGINRVLIRQVGFAGGAFSFQLFPVPQEIVVNIHDLTLPDAVDSTSLDMPAGIPVLNTSDHLIGPITLHVDATAETEPFDTVIPRLIPFSELKMPVMLRSRAPILRTSSYDTIMIPVSMRWKSGTLTIMLPIRICNKDEVRKITFISSMDGSAQYYAVAPPLPSTAQPGMILALHGASVEAQGMAKAYLRKDWAYVVAPTNRRPFGFDWQDWGANDALEVLADARRRFAIDTNRIWLDGHSMGGHGTWSVGIHHPDLFASLAPSAGWTSLPLYIPWTFQRSQIYAAPLMLAERDRALRQDDLPAFAGNLINTPVFVLQGGSDDNVPPIQARLWVDILQRAGDSVAYEEVPWMKHWWNRPATPGTDCIDDSTMMMFVRSHTRNPFPIHVHLHTVDLAQSNSAYWIRIDEVEKPFEDATLDAALDTTVDPRRIDVTTQNIRAFTVVIPPAAVSGARGVEIVIDHHEDITITGERSLGEESFTWTGDHFESGRDTTTEIHKTPALFGPMKQATFTPFALVYGTAGDSTATALSMQKARTMAQIWWRYGNGTA